MLVDYQYYLTFENIYLWSNFGILPFWIMLILIPNSRISQILINSIILPLLFSTLYVYVLYKAFLMSDPLSEIFKLYLSLDMLYTIFSTESFLLIFWLHFLIINLFIGSWVSRDAAKYNMTRRLVALPLIFIYFTGPIGLIIYWIVRVFYAKKLGFHD